MTPSEFVYWLQGFLEIENPQEGLTQEQTEKIKKRLDTIFKHETEVATPQPTIRPSPDKRLRC